MTNNNQKRYINSLEDFSKPLEAINKSFATMERRFEKLNRVNDDLVKFNDAFSAFLYGIVVNDTRIDWDQVHSYMKSDDKKKVLTLYLVRLQAKRL